MAGGIAATIGNAHAVEDMTIGHSIVVGNTVHEIDGIGPAGYTIGNVYPHDVFTGSVFYFTDNDRFLQGSKLENDPLYAIQGHLIYTFRPGLWASVSTAYGDGAKPTVSGVPKDAETENWVNALSVGIPLSRRQGIKLSYLSARTQVPTGADLDTILLTFQTMF